MESIKNIFTYMKEISFFDILDILLVWIVFYFIYKFIRERRVTRLAVGVLILFVFRFVSEFFHLRALEFILTNVLQVGFIALVVVFQPELRSALEKVGGEPIRSLKSLTDSKAAESDNDVIANICEAVCDMALDRTGALIVVERYTDLSSFVKSGTEIDANVQSFLLRNIFYDKAPLHDGAVIIKHSRIIAAGCFLPLSNNPDIVKDLGTRHRAAIGMSEQTDALVIVVSEETGTISCAKEGVLTRNLDYNKLQKVLQLVMMPKSEKTHASPVNSAFRRLKQVFVKDDKTEEKEENDE